MLWRDYLRCVTAFKKLALAAIGQRQLTRGNHTHRTSDGPFYGLYRFTSLSLLLRYRRLPSSSARFTLDGFCLASRLPKVAVSTSIAY